MCQFASVNIRTVIQLSHFQIHFFPGQIRIRSPFMSQVLVTYIRWNEVGNFICERDLLSSAAAAADFELFSSDVRNVF